VLAHRYFYEKVNGLIPEGMQVLHTCDNPLCINPKHLFLGTQSDNMKDASNKKRLRGYAILDQNGENHPNAKLTWDKVEEIRGKYKGGMIRYRELAEMYNVNQATIGYVIRRDTWRR